MDHFQEIYARHAAEYHRMIAVEDCDRHLAGALLALAPTHGMKMLDLGTGTGRLPILFHPIPGQVVGIDLYPDMLRQNQVERERIQGRWELAQADMRSIPFQDAWADLVTAGWSIGHLRSWYAVNWQIQMDLIIHEMARLTKPGGWMVILETMTTGSLTPAPPTPQLAEYYAWLETAHHFKKQVVGTDYAFSSVDEAVSLTTFFFGDELAALIRKNGWSRLPEWTGIWCKQRI